MYQFCAACAPQASVSDVDIAGRLWPRQPGFSSLKEMVSNFEAQDSRGRRAIIREIRQVVSRKMPIICFQVQHGQVIFVEPIYVMT